MADAPLTVVICFDHASITGGQAKVAFDSAVGLKRQGHRPIIFAAVGPIAPQLAEAGIETICLDQDDLIGNPSKLAAAVQGIWNGPAAKALDALLQRLPRENTIVHVHGWAKALSPSIAGPIARSGLPAVYSIHEYFQFCPNGGFYNYQRRHICHLTPLSAACWATNCDSRNYLRKLWRNVRLLTAKRIAHLPDIFSNYIAISGFQEDIVAPLVPKHVTLHRVSNPVSVPDLGPKPDPLSGEVIFVGRLSPEKGTLLFAEAARRIGMIPTFIGDGPVTAELAAKYPEARLLGWRDPAGVQSAMRAARALVFPSIWYEGQPLTVLEAKGLGVPIIVSDACAGREEVEDGVTGLWFKSQDVDDLARALAVTRDDLKIAAMSKAAYAAYWRDPSTLDAHVGRITRIYRGMIAGGTEAKRAVAGHATSAWSARAASL
ncbi:glycosyltransferase family 4 protein [Beijerinckia sp. L45]|uniref:glycosyltransferase family 4 protein n=1 Tax=Beijerinckia sp. L45 TaxID=1641855 RepID=UPI00131B26D9|nr:glycosyltransferase family 4 protein [Beijerinckia sp. L45]